MTGLVRWGTLTLVSSPWCNEQHRFWKARHKEQHVKCRGKCDAAIAAWDQEHGK